MHWLQPQGEAMLLKLVEDQVEVSFDATWYGRMNDDWMFPVTVLVNVMDTETWRVANIYLDAADLTGLTKLIDDLVVDVDHPVAVNAILDDMNEYVCTTLNGNLLNVRAIRLPYFFGWHFNDHLIVTTGIGCRVHDLFLQCGEPGKRLSDVLEVRMDIRHEETPLPQEQHQFAALFVPIAVGERKVSKRQLLVAERRSGCQVEVWVAGIVAHDHCMIARWKVIQPITIERRIGFNNRMVEAEHICAVHFVHGHTELMYQLTSIVLHEPAHEVGLVVVLHMATLCIRFPMETKSMCVPQIAWLVVRWLYQYLSKRFAS